MDSTNASLGCGAYADLHMLFDMLKIRRISDAFLSFQHMLNYLTNIKSIFLFHATDII
jgi:hypothetical protein